MMRTELTILKNLVYNDEYSKKVLPFLKSEYFSDRTDKLLHEHINEFILKYNSLPSYESLVLSIKERSGLTAEEVQQNFNATRGVYGIWLSPAHDWSMVLLVQ